MSEEEFEFFDKEKEYSSSLVRAYRYLAMRDYSRQEMRNKLLQKGGREETVERVLEVLEEQKYIDDEQYARDLVHHCQRVKKLGYYGVLREMKRKGLSGEMIENTLYEEYSPETETENIIGLTEKKLSLGKEMDKIILFLKNKGYEWNKILEVLRGRFKL